MRVLFLAFEFSPMASGGVHRAIKLAKYLPRLGVSLDIVTINIDEVHHWSGSRLDETLLNNMPDSVTIHRIPSGFPDGYWSLCKNPLGNWILKYLFLGDPVSFFWKKPLFKKIDELFKEKQFDVLLSTAPPFGVSVLARELAERYKLPWVSDWRDPWTLWGNAPFTSYLHYRHVRKNEEACLKKADISVCTSPVTRDDWIKEFKGVSKETLQVICNSFDPEELNVKAILDQNSDKVRIVYVGSFYYHPKLRSSVLTSRWKKIPHQWLHYVKRREDWLYRSPYFFLMGLKLFIDKNLETSKKIEVLFAGPIPEWLPQMLKETGTDQQVQLLGPVPHAKCLDLQAGADAVLLTSAKVEGGLDYSIAGKLYEYFGLRKKILAVVTKGAMRDLVEKSGLGIITDPDSFEETANAIGQIVRSAKSPLPLLPGQEEFLRSFNSENMARQMANQLAKASGSA